MSIHTRNVWWEIAEVQIPKLFEIIREQRAEIKAFKARLAAYERAGTTPNPPATNPLAAERGRALMSTMFRKST